MTAHSSQSGAAGIHPEWVDALAHYGATPAAFDELMREGEVREHWLPLLGQPLERSCGAQSAFDDSLDGRRDALPFVIGAEEWRSIEAGLAQRARLLNAINADLYGTQRLFREQGFPPALAFANSKYLPAVRALRPAVRRSACSPSTSAARPTAAGGCSPIAPRRRPGWGSPFRTESTPPTC